MYRTKLILRLSLLTCVMLVLAICAVAITGTILKSKYKPNASVYSAVLNQPEDFTYNDLADGSVEVTGFADSDYDSRNNLEVSIPDKNPDGKTVTRIGNNAFKVLKNDRSTREDEYCG